jgi:hypothetical protein
MWDCRLQISDCGLGDWGINHQIPNLKHQAPNKSQFSKHKIQNQPALKEGLLSSLSY